MLKYFRLAIINDEFDSSTHVRYFDKHFVTSSSENQHFIGEQKKCSKF